MFFAGNVGSSILCDDSTALQNMIRCLTSYVTLRGSLVVLAVTLGRPEERSNSAFFGVEGGRSVGYRFLGVPCLTGL